MSYQPSRYHNPLFEEIERNFGFDPVLVERDRKLAEEQRSTERPDLSSSE